MPSQELEALYHCVYSLHYHLVIVTKYRRQVLTAAMLDRFEFLARERVEAWGGRLIEVNGEADHVHLLFTQTGAVCAFQFRQRAEDRNQPTTTLRVRRRA
jgi:REP element-mobilizing transposase RayT